MKEEFTTKDLHKAKTSDFIRLFEYMEEVSKIIGREKALEILEDINTRNRLDWLNKNKDKLNQNGNPIDLACEIFYQEYLNLPLTPENVKIVEKTENKLVTRWHNFCPQLEACKTLGLDTREICRKCYEKPVQTFLSQINPKLKFRRNYIKIRPHADSCEEIIEMTR